MKCWAPCTAVKTLNLKGPIGALRVASNGAQGVCDDAVDYDALDLADCVVVVLQAEYERRAERLVQAGQELRKAQSETST